MPGFDGTGPRGQGPMSGRGNGFCMLCIPDDPSARKTGFAGRGGRPFHEPGTFRAGEMLDLRARLRELQAGLDWIRSRQAALDAAQAGGRTPLRAGEKP